MEDTGYNKSINNLKRYGLSFHSIIEVMDCVKAYQNYESLPQATKDSIQVISDLYNVSFGFVLLKRKKLTLIGIHNSIRATYLYTDDTLEDRQIKKHWPRNPVYLNLNPGSNNILIKE